MMRKRWNHKIGSHEVFIWLPWNFFLPPPAIITILSDERGFVGQKKMMFSHVVHGWKERPVRVMWLAIFC